LPIVTYEAVDRSGHDPAGNLVTNLPQGAGDLVGAAFASDIGVDNDPIDAAGGYIWYDVAGITPARDRTLAEVKSQVETRWHDDEVAARLKSKANDLLEKLKSGTPLDTLAAADNLKVETATGLKRDQTSASLTSRMLEAIFRTAKDGFGNAQGDTPSQWILFSVTDIQAPSFDADSAASKSMAQDIQRQLSDDLIGQYMLQLEGDLGTSINAAALAQAMGSGTPDTN